jgi:hypothetical protein
MNWFTYMKYMIILKWNTMFRKKEDRPGQVYIYEQDLDKDK